MILARVPIYGTADADRKIWQRFREVIVDESGFRENQISQALNAYIDANHALVAILCTRINDMMWAAVPEAAEKIQKFLDSFAVRKIE